MGHESVVFQKNQLANSKYNSSYNRVINNHKEQECTKFYELLKNNCGSKIIFHSSVISIMVLYR